MSNQRSPGWITDKVAGTIEGKTPAWCWWAFIPSLGLLLLMLAMITYLVSTGIGVWGLNHPVMWGWAIINFVWWIGIGHAGTLILAILFLLRQRWRTSINRAAEAMPMASTISAGSQEPVPTTWVCIAPASLFLTKSVRRKKTTDIHPSADKR